MRGRLGPRRNDTHEVRVLNRYIKWPENGDPQYEADPRHAQLIIKSLNLEGGNIVTSPIVKRDMSNMSELPSAQVTTYRSLTMRGAYLAQDRYDIQHSTKELATEMKTPTNEGMVRLKRLARYLKGAPRVVQTIKRQTPRDRDSPEVVVDVDSDWAGDKVQRKSTLCIVIRHGPNVIKTMVNAMKSISLSSGEAEYAAIVKGACHGLGTQSFASDWGNPLKLSLIHI